VIFEKFSPKNVKVRFLGSPCTLKIFLVPFHQPWVVPPKVRGAGTTYFFAPWSTLLYKKTNQKIQFITATTGIQSLFNLIVGE
jgi:hypothetical protein